MSTSTIPTVSAAPTPADRTRQVVVTAAEVFCVFGTLVGLGVLGTRVVESSGGALAADATRIAPASPAFSIWTVIYLGLAAYTVWQWLPRVATSERARRTGWLAAASMVLNAAWLLVTQRGWIWVSVGVIVALLVVLGVLVTRLTAARPADRLEAVVLDGTFGAYLGWVSVAVCANVTAALVASGVEPSALVSDLLAVGLLLVVGAIGAWLAVVLRARWAVALAMAWGLAWIVVGRTLDEPRSWPTALAAAVAAVAILLATAARRRATR